ncbi:MAG: hypothetical protein ACOVSI_11765 [Gemmatimonas sp.]|jgi:hypothetical protein
MTNNLSKTLSIAAAFAAAFALANCDGAPGDHPSPLLGTAEVPTMVGPLDIGGSEPTAPTSVQALSRSLIAIVDNYEPKITLVHAQSGKVAASFGRRGRGPGEILSIGPLQLLSDSTLLVPDAQQARATIWNFATDATSMIALHQRAVARNVVPSLIGYSGNQRWVSRQLPMAESRGVSVRSVSESSTLVLVDSVESRTLVMLPPRALVVAPSSNRVSRMGLGALAPAALAVCDSGFVNVDTSGVKRYSPSGALLESHRHRLGWAPLHSDAKLAYITAAVSGVADSKIRRQMSTSLAALANRIDRLLVGFYIAPDGSVWIRVRTENENAIVQLDKSGAQKRRVAVPSGIAVAQVGIGHYVGMRITSDAETPQFSLFTFAEGISDRHSLWRCGQQYDY